MLNYYFLGQFDDVMADIVEKMQSMGLSEYWTGIISYGLYVIVIAFLAFIANYIAKKFILKIITGIAKKTKYQWDNLLVERGVFLKLSHLAPAIVIYFLADMLLSQHPTLLETILRATRIYMLIVAMFFVDSLLNCLVEISRGVKSMRNLPVRGFVQVVKIVLYIAVVISVLSFIMGKNPGFFLGGMGAMTAIIMLIFKDSILGFVAGIQLSANNMVQIDDWVEMPAFGADGDVIDISLNVVKIRNWDMTISTIPTYAMVTHSFKNWRGMSESGGRRIMRSVDIDITSIKFCDQRMLDKFKKIQYISQYIDSKLTEINQYNKSHNVDECELVNGRRLTNIGTFRAYIVAYLQNHPQIRQDMTFLVRQLQSSEKGLPIQIYVFCSDNRWAYYESIQADIFDHIFAVLSEFELRAYQLPTGMDLRSVIGAIGK